MSHDAHPDDAITIVVEASQGGAGIGRVTAAGERAGALVERRVVFGPIDPCGECDVCRRGGAAVCPGLHRRERVDDRVTVAARWAVPLDDGLDLPVPAGAAVAGDAALAYTLYARTGVGPREPVVVVGASSIARLLFEILRAKAVDAIAVVDDDPTRAAWVEWLGSRGIARAANADAIDAALSTDGLGGKTWRVIAASPDAIATAAALAGPRATLTVLGPVANLPGELVAREVTVIGVAGAHPDLVVEVAAMCAKGDIDLAAATAEAPTADFRSVVKRHA